MQPNQFKKTNNPVATFGENSQSVRDLQTQLNSQGANLAVDGMFGTKTQAAQGQFAPAGEPVVAPELEPELPVSSFVAPTGQIEDRETLRLRRDQERLLNRKQKSDDEIRRDTLRQFQGQIDATNSIFADELGRAQVAGRGRLGSQTAMSARRGLIGSDFGESQIQGRENENEQVFQGIENARNAKVQFLLGQARTDASAAILAKNQAFSEGLDARLAFRNEAESRKTNNTTKAVRSILNQGFDIGQLQKGELQQLASFYGISTDDITNNFADGKRAFDVEKAQADFKSKEQKLGLAEIQAGIDSGKFIKLAEGNSLVNTETGEIIKNQKTRAVSSGGGTGGGTTYTEGEYAGVIDTILGSGSFTKQQRSDVINSINKGEDPSTVIKNQAIKILGTEGTALRKSIKARETFNALGENLEKFYELGGSTNLVKGTFEEMNQKFGEVDNPELRILATQIQKNLMGYRNAISGTAYSEQEGRDIQNVFPGINKSEELNNAIVRGNLINFDSEIDAMFIQAIGSTAYEQVKSLQSANIIPDEVVNVTPEQQRLRDKYQY